MKRSCIRALIVAAVVVLAFIQDMSYAEPTDDQNAGSLLAGPWIDVVSIGGDMSPTIYWGCEPCSKIKAEENYTVAYQIRLSKKSNNEVVYQSAPIITEEYTFHIPICFLETAETEYYCEVRGVLLNRKYFTSTSEETDETIITPISLWGRSNDFWASSKCKFGTTDDTDCDGIPDDVETDKIGTDPEMKTLFVRPLKQNEAGGFDYWSDFIELFHEDFMVDAGAGRECEEAKKKGFVKIAPFEKAGIEIVVIGEPAPERTYRPFNSLSYDPARSDDSLGVLGGKLPCDIMEIRYLNDKESDSGDLCYSNMVSYTNNGHISLGAVYTYLDKISTTVYNWQPDNNGYTVYNKCPHHYHIPRLYKLPLENYFSEGAYNKIEVGDTAKGNTTNCSLGNDDCGSDKLSPLNLKDPQTEDNPLQPPFNEIPYHNNEDTVEFTPFKFDQSGKVTYTPQKVFFDPKLGTAFKIKPDCIVVRPYKKREVIKRNVVHEMGHALMGGGNADHCYNPKCIMYAYPLDWELREFGPPCGETGTPCCEHRPCGSLDVRAGVYNTVH